MEATVVNPYYTSDNKNQIIAQFHTSDGAIQTLTVNKPADGKTNEDWDLIFSQHSEEQIEELTSRYLEDHRRQQDQAKRREKAAKIEKENELLFQIKLESFEMDEVTKSTNRVLKSKLRRAKNTTEVYAYTAAIILDNEKVLNEEPSTN